MNLPKIEYGNKLVEAGNATLSHQIREGFALFTNASGSASRDSIASRGVGVEDSRTAGMDRFQAEFELICG
jgi:hypothetical protein